MQAIRNRSETLLKRAAEPTDLARVPTGIMRPVDVSKAKTAGTSERGGRPLVLPLRKVQSTFPSMITIGRTENNDLVVSDEQVSKFHAFFRIVGDRVELSDAGSRNGTFVGSQKLAARGAGAPVNRGDRFALRRHRVPALRRPRLLGVAAPARPLRLTFSNRRSKTRTQVRNVEHAFESPPRRRAP